MHSTRVAPVSMNAALFGTHIAHFVHSFSSTAGIQAINVRYKATNIRKLMSGFSLSSSVYIRCAGGITWGSRVHAAPNKCPADTRYDFCLCGMKERHCPQYIHVPVRRYVHHSTVLIHQVVLMPLERASHNSQPTDECLAHTLTIRASSSLPTGTLAHSRWAFEDPFVYELGSRDSCHVGASAKRGPTQLYN